MIQISNPLTGDIFSKNWDLPFKPPYFQIGALKDPCIEVSTSFDISSGIDFLIDQALMGGFLELDLYLPKAKPHLSTRGVLVRSFETQRLNIPDGNLEKGVLPFVVSKEVSPHPGFPPPLSKSWFHPLDPRSRQIPFFTGSSEQAKKGLLEKTLHFVSGHTEMVFQDKFVPYEKADFGLPFLACAFSLSYQWSLENGLGLLECLEAWLKASGDAYFVFQPNLRWKFAPGKSHLPLYTAPEAVFLGKILFVVRDEEILYDARSDETWNPCP